MKQTGTCPKCNGTDIYTDRGCMKRGDRSSIGISSWKKFFLDVYICMACGFTEEYVSEDDFKDPKKLAALKENWKKHQP